MSKEMFIAAHERLVEEYLEKNPNATDAEAFAYADERAYDRSKDMFADMVDAAKQRAKDAGNWPPKKGVV